MRVTWVAVVNDPMIEVKTNELSQPTKGVEQCVFLDVQYFVQVKKTGQKNQKTKRNLVLLHCISFALESKKAKARVCISVILITTKKGWTKLKIVQWFNSSNMS